MNMSSSSEEDEVISEDEVEIAKPENITNPPSIKLSSDPTAINFHPENDIIAVALFNETVELYEYSTESNKKKSEINLPDDYSPRELAFSCDGKHLYVALSSSELQIYDVETNKFVYAIKGEDFGSPAQSILPINDSLISVGDDAGCVSFIDTRKQKVVKRIQISKEYITSLAVKDNHSCLIACSSDGLLTKFNLPSMKNLNFEKEYKEEIIGIGFFKQEGKLALGDGGGNFNIFNWNEFEECSDIFPSGKPMTTFIPVTDQILVAGGEDGNLRAFHLFPHKNLGIVGTHKYPVEKLDICNDGHLIASTTSDEFLRFWDVRYFEDPSLSKVVRKSDKDKKKKERKNVHLASSNKQNPADFFKDLL